MSTARPAEHDESRLYRLQGHRHTHTCPFSREQATGRHRSIDWIPKSRLQPAVHLKYRCDLFPAVLLIRHKVYITIRCFAVNPEQPAALGKVRITGQRFQDLIKAALGKHVALSSILIFPAPQTSRQFLNPFVTGWIVLETR